MRDTNGYGRRRPTAALMEHPMKARVWSAAGLVWLGGGLAFAGEPVFERDAAATVLAGAYDHDAVEDPEAAVARASVFGRAGLLFDNQIEAGVGLGVAAERDHPGRDPRGGRAGDCPPTALVCPSAGGASLRGAVSGYTPIGVTADRGPRLSLETAYLYVRNGLGEASVGRSRGAAALIGVGAPSIFVLGGAGDSPVDATSLGGPITSNDISGQSAKALVQSERILGFKGAFSYTPELELEGLDQGFPNRPGAPLTHRPEAVVEVGGSFDHRFQNGWQIAATGTWATAEDVGGRSAFGRMGAWGLGATVGREGWTVGASYLENDNGWVGGGRDYTALSISGVIERGAWAFSLEGATASDDLVFTDSSAVTLGTRRTVSENLSIAGGLTLRERRSPLAAMGGRAGLREMAKGAFIEIAVGL
jgi:Gram-negative porin